MISACSKAGCYAVLASLSGRYPPLEGRSPTCYSPVRHSTTHCWVIAFDLHVLGTPPALILSQDQTLKLKCLPAPHCCGHQRYLNVDRLLIGSLALFTSSCPTASSSRELHTVGLNTRQGFRACTFYLVFKEPDYRLPKRHPARKRAVHPSGLSPSGEPYNTTCLRLACQPLPKSFFRIFSPGDAPSFPMNRLRWLSVGVRARGRQSAKKFAPVSYLEQIVPATMAGSRSASTNIRVVSGRVNPV